METNKILTANILDIIFEGKNKDYGAYDLRNTYGKRVGTALGFTAGLILLFAAIVLTRSAQRIYTPSTVFDFEPQKAPEEKVKNSLPASIKITPKSAKAYVENVPIIVKGEVVTQKPAEVETSTEPNIGSNSNNEDHKETMTPLEINSQVLEKPLIKETEDGVPFTRIEIEAKFKGNWNTYIKKKIEKNIEELTEAGESGTCIVKFVVAKDGTVSEVEAITMQGTKLAEIAVDVIRKGPKWIPAQQNGTIVKAFRQQPITFTIND